MVADRPLAGALVDLPAPCAGDMLPGIDLPCSADSAVAIWGPILGASDEPVMVLVTTCKHHARHAVRYLRDQTPMPDLIQTWGLRTFLESQGAITREFEDIHVLTRVA